MRIRIVILNLMLSVSVAGCHSLYTTQDLPMNPMTEDKSRLAFTCVHESIPKASEESDMLFKYARWMQKNNLLKQDPHVNAEIERLYRIAAEHQHHKANVNLQIGSRLQRFKLSGDEYQRLSQKLIDAGVASGYYLFGIFLDRGASGVVQDRELALRYFRKAADTGSADAQWLVADKLAPIDIAPYIAREMRRCAAEQGHGRAAVMLGIHLKNTQQHDEALKFFQVGVAAGYDSAAGRLEEAFGGPPPSNTMYYLGQEKDLERAERYKKIWRILSNYSYANPKVPEINDIVPLPPAPLPEWDGKLQWLEERLANVQPPKPDEALITRLAKEKGLDPKTGKPLPGSPAFNQANFPVMIRYSGEVCPESGHWKVIWPPGRNVLYRKVTRHFEQGQVFPSERVNRFHLRPWPFSDKQSGRDEPVEWGLLG